MHHLDVSWESKEGSVCIHALRRATSFFIYSGCNATQRRFQIRKNLVLHHVGVLCNRHRMGCRKLVLTCVHQLCFDADCWAVTPVVVEFVCRMGYLLP